MTQFYYAYDHYAIIKERPKRKSSTALCIRIFVVKLHSNESDHCPDSVCEHYIYYCHYEGYDSSAAIVFDLIVFSTVVAQFHKMSNHTRQDDREASESGHIDPILPNFGVTIASDQMSLQLCRPKLMPLKTYSYMRVQLQVRNRLEQSNIASNERI